MLYLVLLFKALRKQRLEKAMEQGKRGRTMNHLVLLRKALKEGEGTEGEEGDDKSHYPTAEGARTTD